MELSEDKSSLKISKRNEEKYRKDAEILQQGMNRWVIGGDWLQYMCHTDTSLCVFGNWRIDNAYVRPSEMTFGSTKWWKLLNAIMYNVILGNQKTESFVFRWLLAHAMFDTTCFSAFVKASDVNSSILPIRYYWLKYIVLNSIFYGLLGQFCYHRFLTCS